MTTIDELANRTETVAKRLGIRKFDVCGSTSDSTSVQVDRGEPKQVKASTRQAVTVRVWNDANAVGITSTTDTDENGIELALQTAREASEFGVKEHAPDFSPEATVPIQDDEGDRTAENTPADTLIQALLDAEKQLLDAHTDIESVPYNGLSQKTIARFYLNSEGSRRQEALSYSTLYLYSKTAENGKKPRSAGAIRLDRAFDNLDISGCVKEAAEKTISHLNYQKIKSGRYRVVFSADAFLSLLGAFSNLFNAQSILDKQSLSTLDSLGEEIASPLLSVCDDARHRDRVAAHYFDGEGTPTRRVSLIESGVLTGFLHSAGTAKRTNSQPTGHANMGAKVTVSPDFFHVFPGKNSDRDYSLETEENVVFIDELSALHAGVNALEGSFSLPLDGWLVNKGDRVSIDSATVAGDFRDLLKAIVYVGKEPEVLPNGICPQIWVDGLSITGE